MTWKVIGQSVIGASHIANDNTCEDAIRYEVYKDALICFVSDGAGSAKYAAMAADETVQLALNWVKDWMDAGIAVDDNHLLQLAESAYENLNELAVEHAEPLNEFSCTLLGFILLPEYACFIQIGDGAIVRNDGEGFFTPLWWPHNGEYQNTTTFLIDDPNFRNLKTKVINETIDEVAIFTDGLQMLALNNELENVHQPFFNDLFKWLRKATEQEHIDILNNKLATYLGGPVINNRTDDDKTLLLATRIKDDAPNL